MNWPRLLYSKGRSTGGRWEHGAWPRNLPRRLPFFPSNQTTNPGYSPFFPLFHHSRLCGGAECIYLCQTSSSRLQPKTSSRSFTTKISEGPKLQYQSEKLEQLTKEREMTVRKTVPGTQLLLYSAAVLVVAPLLLWMLYLFWLVWMRLFWLVQFSLEFFFLCFFHRCCQTTGEFLNGQYVSVLVANIVIH